jgi:hypothetical protein
LLGFLGLDAVLAILFLYSMYSVIERGPGDDESAPVAA